MDSVRLYIETVVFVNKLGKEVENDTGLEIT